MTTLVVPAPRHNRRVAEAEQKNLYLPADVKRHFEEWADRHGYAHAKAFTAGFLALAALSPSQRDSVFGAIAEWQKDGYKPPIDEAVRRIASTGEATHQVASQRSRSA